MCNTAYVLFHAAQSDAATHSRNLATTERFLEVGFAKDVDIHHSVCDELRGELGQGYGVVCLTQSFRCHDKEYGMLAA